MRSYSVRAVHGILLATVLLLAIFHSPAPPTALAGESLSTGVQGFGVPGSYITWNPANFPITYTVDGPAAGNALGIYTSAQAVSLFVDSQFAVWAAVPTASLSFSNAGAITSGSSGGCVTDGNVSTLAEYNCLVGANFPGNPMIFDLDGTLTDLIAGAGASNGLLGFAGPVTSGNAMSAFHVGGRAFLNGKMVDGIGPMAGNNEVSEEEMQATGLHEFGHFLGLGHSQINDSCFTNAGSCPTGSDASFGGPTMYPIAYGLQETGGTVAELTLAMDDVTWISMFYPNGSFAANHSTISGQLLTSDGLGPIQGGNIIARQVDDPATMGLDESLRCAVSVVSGDKFTVNLGQTVTGNNPPGVNSTGSTDPTLAGAYTIPVPINPMGGPAACAAAATKGTYRVSTESINSQFTGGSSVGPHGRFFGIIFPLPGAAPAPSGVIDVTGSPATNVNILLVGGNPSSDAAEGASRNDTIATAAPIGNGNPALLGHTISPMLSTGPDVDVYSFTALAGQTVTFDLNAEFTYNSFIDTVIEIVNSSNTRVNLCRAVPGVGSFNVACLNDDDPGGGTFDSRLEFQSPSAGAFYLRVLDWRGDARPDLQYDLVVSGAGAALSAPGCTKDFDNGGGDNSWNTATNWNPDGVPTATDDVCIGGFTINSTVNNTVASITNSLGLLNVSGGTLTATTSIDLTGGTLRLSGGSVSSATITLSNGLIDGGAPGTLTGNLVQTGGSIGPGLSPGILNVTGNFTQSVGATIAIEIGGTAGAGVVPNGHDQLNASGTAVVDGTFNIVYTNGFTAAIGDQFTIATCGGGVNCGSGNPVLNFPAAPAGGVWQEIGSANNNMLIIGVVAATKDFDNDSNDNTWENPLNWTGDSLPTNTDNVQIGVNPMFPGPFTVTKSGAGGDSIDSLTIADGQGLFTLSGGTLTIASASSIGNGGFTQSGGTLNGAGSLTITGAFTWSGGTQSGGGSTTVSSPLSITGGVTLDSRTLNNNGLGSMSGSGNLTLANGATFNNNGSGTFDIQNDGGISGSGGEAVNNAGTFTKSGGTGSTVSAIFNNTGAATITVGGGATLDFTGGGTCGGTCSGTWSAVAGATLGFGGTFDLTGGVSGAGEVETLSGATTIRGPYNISGMTNVNNGNLSFVASSTITNIGGTLRVQNATLDLSSGETVAPTVLNQSGGTLMGTDTVNVSGLFTWSGGSQQGSGNAVTNANGGIAITTGSGKSMVGRRVVNAAGQTATVTGAQTIASASAAGSTGGFVNNGIFDVQVDVIFSTAAGIVPFEFTNGATGTFTKSAGAGTTAFGVDFISSGNVNANSGTIAFNSVTNSFTGGTVQLNGGGITIGTLTLAGGTLRGNGTVTGNVTNTGGTVGAGLSPGTLNIIGNYTQGAAGTMIAELGGFTQGTQYDLITVSLTATLAGTLQVDPFMAFVPSGNFTILTANSIVGDFATKTNNTAGTSFMAAPSGNNYVVSFAAAACNVNFDFGAGTSAWETAGNWDTNTVPTAADNVCIDAGSFAVTVTMAGQAANSLTVTGTVFPFTLSGGSLTLASSSSIAGAFDQSGGTLDGAGSLSIGGTFTWSSGAQQGAGGITNANGGMTLNTGGTKTLNTGRTLNNTGMATWTDGEFFIGNGAVFNNQMTGTFDIQHAGTRNFGGGVGGGSTVNNIGTMTKSAGGGLTVVNAGFNNTGTLNANDGTFRLISAANASASTGAFNVGAGTLEFNNGTYDLNAGATVSGAGTTTIVSGTVNMNMGSSITTAVSMSGGVLNLATGGTVTLPSLTQTGGTVTGTGILDITGAFTWSAGDHTGTGTTNANGGMTLNTGGTKSLNTGRTLNNAGMATWTDGEFFIGNGGVFNNAMTGVFDIQHGGTRNLGGGVGGSSTVNNAGTMTKSAGGGLTVVNAGFNNTGTLNANDGTFRLISASNPSTSTGAFNVGAGTLEFNNGTYNLNSGATVSGAGTTSITAGTVNMNVGSSITTAVSMSGGTLNLTTGAAVTLPTLTQTGGTVTGTDTLNITGVFTWSAGDQTGAGITNALGTLTMNTGGSKTLNTGRTLNNDGGGTWTDGEFFIGNGAVFTNTVNGLFDIQHAGNRNFGGGVGGVSTVNNDGTILKSGAGNTIVNASYNNNAASVLNVNAGNMQFNAAFTQSGAGSVTFLNGGNLDGGGTFQFNGGVLNAIGGSTITGNVVNAGATVNPGTSPGILNINGTYTQGAMGVLNIELAGAGGVAGTDFDVVNITGSAALDGTLNVVSFGGFMAGAGSSFQVMNYASVSGDFATKNGLNIATPPLQGFAQPTFYLLTNAIDADLTVTKTDSPDPVNVGSNLTYTVTVTNNGPFAATGVTLTDTLPANVSFVSAVSTVGTCMQAAGVVTCNIGNLAVSANAVVTIVVTPNAMAVPTISNMASATANENDPNVADNTDTETTTVNPVVDLSVTKTDSPDPVTQGQDVTYTVTVANAGPNNATNVTLTDNLPASVTFVSATPSQGACMQAAGTVTCALGTINSGANATVTIVVTTTGMSIPSISNTASVTATETDSNTANDSATETTAVTPLTANLTVTKTDAADPVNVGDNITYTVTVSNGGPDPATNVSLTDTLPASVNFVSATPSQGACGAPVGNVLTCTLGTINNAANATVTIVVTTTAASAPSVSDTASATASETDPVPADNSATETTTVNAVADLDTNKSDAADPVLAGQNITYTITITNLGPSTATGVSVTDTLPASTTFVSATPSQGTCSQAAGVVTCAIGTLNNGANATVTIVVTTTAASVPTVQNTMVATANEFDPDPVNSNSLENTAVNPAVDMAVTKTDSPDPVNVGSNITYTITVTNNGPSAATNVSLSDMLPAGTTFVSLTAPAGWTTTTPAVGAGGTVTATIAALAAATPQTFTLVVAAGSTAVPSVSNTATVTAAEGDPTPANNSATAATTVNPIADLSITKTDSPDPVNNQSNITYTITVANAGPSPAANVTVTDNVPAGTTFVSAIPSVGTCGQAAGVVTCNLGMMASGGNATITLIVTVTGFGPTVTNTATVSSSVTDPVAGNNSASTTTTVNVVVGNDFAISAAPTIQNALPGSSVTYTVTLTPLPPGSAFVNPIGLACFVQPPLSSCSFNPQTVTPGTSPANSTLTVVVPSFAVAPPVGEPGNTAPPVTLWLLALSLAMLGAGAAGRKLARQNAAFAPYGRRMAYCVTFGLVLLVLSLGMAQSACVSQNNHLAGPYTVTINGTAQGGLSHSTTVTVNVQR